MVAPGNHEGSAAAAFNASSLASPSACLAQKYIFFTLSSALTGPALPRLLDLYTTSRTRHAQGTAMLGASSKGASAESKGAFIHVDPVSHLLQLSYDTKRLGSVSISEDR